MEASNLGTPSKRIILLRAVHGCPSGKTAAIERHVSFAQITCKLRFNAECWAIWRKDLAILCLLTF